MKAPEGDAVDLVVVLVEEGEKSGVLLGLALQEFGRQAIRIKVLAFLADVGGGAALPAGHHIEVKFGDHDLQAFGVEDDEGLFDFVEGNVVELPVALDADAVYGRAAPPQIADEPQRLFALLRQLDVVVVVEQFRRGVGLVGGVEGLGEVVLAQRGEPGGGTQVFLSIREGLVDDVPGLHLACVALHHGPDVRAQALAHAFGRGGLAILHEKPVGTLLVPDEGVAVYLKSMVQGQGHQPVGGLEGEVSLGGLQGPGLHAV